MGKSKWLLHFFWCDMEEMKNISLIMEYDGSRYHGWQRQKDAMTIQGIIEDRLRMMIQEPITLIASGRTDAGVHALHQVCHFNTGTKIDPDSIKKGLNSLLPEDIFIKHVQYIPVDFHSRHSVKSKIYEYRVLNCREPNLFLRFFSWHIRERLNLEEMRQCLALLEGVHDFSAFKSTGSRNLNPVREMLHAELLDPKKGVFTILFEANGFLRHMVRNIVGTLIEVGRGRIGLDDFREIFQSKDRRKAGMKAPPQGLFLRMVKY